MLANSFPNIPVEWQWYQLKDICSLITDGSHFSPKPQLTGQPIGNVKDMRDGFIDIENCTKISQKNFQLLKRNNCSPKIGDVLLSKDGTIGKVIVFNQNDEIVLLSSITIIRPSSSVNSWFLGQVLKSFLFTKQIEAFTSGSALRRMVLRDIGNLFVPLASLSEQQYIAEILDTIDEAIAHTSSIIAKLKQIKAGLLHDLLTRGLDENGELRDAIAHPEQFKDSPLGKIPKDWNIQALVSVTSKIQDGTHFSPKSKEGQYRYITSKNIRSGYIDLTDCGWISEIEHNQIYRRCDVQKGDILLTKDGVNVGNVAINNIEAPFSLLSSVAFIRPNYNFLIAEFILQYILSPIGQRRLADMVSGLAITRLTLEKIKLFEILIPPIGEQKNIVATLEIHDTRIRTEEAYLEKLKLQKKGLMHDLLTGKVRVNQMTQISDRDLPALATI